MTKIISTHARMVTGLVVAAVGFAVFVPTLTSILLPTATTLVFSIALPLLVAGAATGMSGALLVGISHYVSKSNAVVGVKIPPITNKNQYPLHENTNTYTDKNIKIYQHEFRNERLL